MFFTKINYFYYRYYQISHIKFRMRKKKLIQQAEILDVVIEVLNRYAHVSQYVEQIMFKKELLSTNQVAEKYFVSRFTVDRMRKSGRLNFVVKHRSYYFDPEETHKFFEQYRQQALN